MQKKYRILLNVVYILIVIFLILLIIFKLGNGFKKSSTYEVVDHINNYAYTLDDRDTSLMRREFGKLKKILESKEINYEEYAKVLSNLFIIDLFTIDNKDSKYDVGGLEYVYPKVKDNFKLNVEDTLYKYISNDKDRKYPRVKEIVSNEIEVTSYTYEKKEYEAYKVNISWNYESDLGYYTKGEVILIKEDNTLYVVAFKGVEES